MAALHRPGLEQGFASWRVAQNLSRSTPSSTPQRHPLNELPPPPSSPSTHHARPGASSPLFLFYPLTLTFSFFFAILAVLARSLFVALLRVVLSTSDSDCLPRHSRRLLIPNCKREEEGAWWLRRFDGRRLTNQSQRRLRELSQVVYFTNPIDPKTSHATPPWPSSPPPPRGVVMASADTPPSSPYVLFLTHVSATSTDKFL